MMLSSIFTFQLLSKLKWILSRGHFNSWCHRPSPWRRPSEGWGRSHKVVPRAVGCTGWPRERPPTCRRAVSRKRTERFRGGTWTRDRFSTSSSFSASGWSEPARTCSARTRWRSRRRRCKPFCSSFENRNFCSVKLSKIFELCFCLRCFLFGLSQRTVAFLPHRRPFYTVERARHWSAGVTWPAPALPIGRRRERCQAKMESWEKL